ncbi:MAG: hypothetical protein HY320_09455 [Armatimonadetes bacterium]|nr:hypothetical protein [Armatimonadota bacterium]
MKRVLAVVAAVILGLGLAFLGNWLRDELKVYTPPGPPLTPLYRTWVTWQR